MKSKLTFHPGFRLSEMDVGILILGICTSVLLARLDQWLGFALLFLLAHFFLFGNVLRMRRLLEILWAVVFVLLAGRTVHRGVPAWNYTLLAMFGVTSIVFVVQIFQPSYHGVLWKKINPNLRQWWAVNKEQQA